MTRLIDADALKGLFIQVLENIKSNPRMTGQEKHIITAIHTVGQMIDDAPTIIPGGGGRVMNLNNPKTLDEAIEIIKEINPEYEETNTRTAETMVLCAVKDGELVDKHTIDAVPVIRCKDCKHRDKETANCTRFRKDWYVQSNSFCSWAEPKEEKR